MTTTYTEAELAGQPIGYWSGEAYRRVAAGLRASFATESLTQPQWWVLNRLEGGPQPRADLVALLAPYSENEEGLDVAAGIEALVTATLVVDDEDTLTLSAAGEDRLAAARARVGGHLATIRTGITDSEYAATIDVLRRIVGNLGGDPRLP